MSIILLTFFSVLVACIFIIILGVVGIKTEITGSSKYWGEYNPNQKYVLTKDVLIHESKLSKRPALFWDESIKGLYNIPDTPDIVKDYKLHSKQYQDLKVIGIVNAGTVLQPSRIRRETGYVLMILVATMTNLHHTLPF